MFASPDIIILTITTITIILTIIIIIIITIIIRILFNSKLTPESMPITCYTVQLVLPLRMVPHCCGAFDRRRLCLRCVNNLHDITPRSNSHLLHCMRNLLGWLETRLAQNTSYYLKIAELTLTNNNT